LVSGGGFGGCGGGGGALVPQWPCVFAVLELMSESFVPAFCSNLFSCKWCEIEGEMSTGFPLIGIQLCS